MIMCKITDYISIATTYITNMIGENIQLRKLSKSLSDSIPTYITNSFALYQGNLLGKSITLACIEDGNLFPPRRVQKLLGIIEQYTNNTVIYVPINIASYNINRLIEQKANFIIPGKQMFLPSLLVDLKKEKLSDADLSDSIPPMAQCILLYHLEKAPLEGKTSKELAELFQVSYANINRAMRWLCNKELITFKGTKTKALEINTPPKELWEKAQPWLINPMEAILYTEDTLPDAIISGINALSEYTMINSEPNQHYALSRSESKELQIVTDKQFGTNVIEIWRYNPHLLSNNGVADKLSLYLTFKNREDERIEIELDNMINEIKW